MSERENSHAIAQTAPSVPQDARGGNNPRSFDEWWKGKEFYYHLTSQAAEEAWEARDAEVAALRADRDYWQTQFALETNALKDDLDEARAAVTRIEGENAAAIDWLETLYRHHMGDISHGEFSDSYLYERVREILARPDGARGAAVIAAAVEESETEDAHEKAWMSVEQFDTEYWDKKDAESKEKRRAAVAAFLEAPR